MATVSNRMGRLLEDEEETMMNAIKKAQAAADRFFRLAEVAARHGGFWVSPAGGTADVVAGVIASRCGIPVEDARRILNQAGREWAGQDWYTVLANIQPFRCDSWSWSIFDPWEAWDEMPGRWDVRAVAKAACLTSCC